MAKYTVKDLMRDLRQGNYTSVGSYPIYFVTADGGSLKPSTVRAELSQVSRATRDYAKNPRQGSDVTQWAIVGSDVNWEDPALYDDHTGERIESAYAEDEAQKHERGGNPRVARGASGRTSSRTPSLKGRIRALVGRKRK